VVGRGKWRGEWKGEWRVPLERGEWRAGESGSESGECLVKQHRRKGRNNSKAHTPRHTHPKAYAHKGIPPNALNQCKIV